MRKFFLLTISLFTISPVFTQQHKELRLPQDPYEDPGLFLGSFFLEVPGVQKLNSFYLGGGSVNDQNSSLPFAVGFKAFTVNPDNPLRFSLKTGYRSLGLSNVVVLDGNDTLAGQNSLGIFELFVGGTFFPGGSLFGLKDFRLRPTISVLGGMQNLNFGGEISAGFHLSRLSNVAGVSAEFVYRPLEFEHYGKGADEISYNILPSWSIRLSLAFIKGGKSFKSNDYDIK